MGELDERIAVLTGRITAVDEERCAIAAEVARLTQVVASMPSSAPVMERRDALVSAVASVRVAREGAEHHEAVARDARRAADHEAAQLRALASERNLAVTAAGIEQAERLVHVFEQRDGSLLSALALLAAAEPVLERASTRLGRAQAEVAER